MPLPIKRKPQSSQFLQQFGSQALPATLGETIDASKDPLSRPTQMLFDTVKQELDDPRNATPKVTGHHPPESIDMLSPEQIRVEYHGLGLNIEEATPRSVVELKADRRRQQMARDDVFARGPQGLGAKAAQFGFNVLYGAVDPINIASAFIPVIGPAGRAGLAAKVGTTGSRAVVGAVDGAVGAAGVELLLTHPLAAELGIEYDMADALTNVALGTILGTGLHVGGGAVGDWLTKKPKLTNTDQPSDHFMIDGKFDNQLRTVRVSPNEPPAIETPNSVRVASPGVNELAFRTSVAQLATGSDLRISALYDTDATLRANLVSEQTPADVSKVEHGIQKKVEQLEAEVRRVEALEKNPNNTPATQSLQGKTINDPDGSIEALIGKESGVKFSKDSGVNVEDAVDQEQFPGSTREEILDELRDEAQAPKIKSEEFGDLLENLKEHGITRGMSDEDLRVAVEAAIRKETSTKPTPRQQSAAVAAHFDDLKTLTIQDDTVIPLRDQKHVGVPLEKLDDTLDTHLERGEILDAQIKELEDVEGLSAQDRADLEEIDAQIKEEEALAGSIEAAGFCLARGT